jgi:soluble lytic murein transglycosylase
MRLHGRSVRADKQGKHGGFRMHTRRSTFQSTPPAMLPHVMAVVGVLGLCATPVGAEQATQTPAVLVRADALTATAHPVLPRDPAYLWLAPPRATRTSRAPARLSAGVRLHAEARYTEALPLVRASVAKAVLANYAQYYTAVTELRLLRLDEASATFQALASKKPQGYLGDAVRLRQAELAELRRDFRAAEGVYRELTASKGLAPETVLSNLARVAQLAGDLDAAAQAWARLYYEFPLSDEASVAQAQLDTLKLWKPFEPQSERFALELGRAERLFASRRYAQARSSLEPLQPIADGEAAEIVALRIAESDFYLKRYAAARDGLEPWIRKASRRAEAQFFYLSAMREVGQHDEYVRLARELVAAWPQESWAEETLNNLATHYILVDDTPSAEGVFREIYERYPNSRHAQRAGWKVGWTAYRQGRFDETIRVFETSAARFPRSDYRPSWIYWAARAHDRLGNTEIANARYALVVSDYQNSYYGRLASRQLVDRRVALPSRGADGEIVRPTAMDGNSGSSLPPTADVIRALIADEMYDDALNELQYAQRVWGDSPIVQATMGLVYSRQGDLRRGINAMKRAYPQYIASGGEDLPPEMLQVLFPVAYWDMIARHSKARGLDPYLIAALVAQESTFDPQIRSHANAVGLMQVLPSTGRRYARRLKLRYRPAMLTQAETNVRLGTAIFADLVQKLGGAHLALASYNAGESAVLRWMTERPGLERDEFIDDIPYPETQNYVKKIIGTAEDYRRLYGPSRAASASHRAHSGRDAASGTSGRSSAHAPKAPTGKSSGKAKAPSKKSGQKKPARKAASKTAKP